MWQVPKKQPGPGAGDNRHRTTATGWWTESRVVSNEKGEPATAGVDRAPGAVEQRLRREASRHRGPEETVDIAHQHHTEQILRPK